MDVEELLAGTLAEMKCGYRHDDQRETYTCLLCGQQALQGVVYPANDVLYDARKFIEFHVADQHGAMLETLLGLPKKWTGLTEHQKELLILFAQGIDDKAVASGVHGRASTSPSTVRTQRFALRERAKQAKVFLALMELLEERMKSEPAMMPVHRRAKMVDERYVMTEAENTQILNRYFPNGLDQSLVELPRKEKRKIAILRHIMGRFERDRRYTEREVNAVLEQVHPDFVTLRRYLIEYGFMDRDRDGSSYWVQDDKPR